MTPQASESLRLGKSFVEALTRRDPAGLLAVLHDQFVMESVFPLVAGDDKAGAGILKGDAVRNFMREVPNILSRVQFKNVIWRTTNDGLAVFEAVGDMAYSDGRPYCNDYLWIIEASEGKLILIKEYFNPLIWARAYGAPLESLPS